MKYKQISVKVKHEEADIVSYAFIELGSEGVSVIDGQDINETIRAKSNWDYFDESLIMQDIENAIITGGYDTGFEPEPLASLIAQYIGREVELIVQENDSQDWENEWRKYYNPIDFGEVVIVPAWLKNEYGERALLLEPGMAFGTGNHETTGMCIKLMQLAGVIGGTVVDVGCGSGILGLAALKLGAKSCIFVDNDAVAADAATANLKLNGYNQTVICGDLVSEVSVMSDIVIANITADILIRLSGDLEKVLKKSGQIIISGIIDGRFAEVIATYAGRFELLKSMHEKEWNAALLRMRV